MSTVYMFTIYLLNRLKKGGELWYSRECPGILRVLNITLVAMFLSHNNIVTSLI